MSRSCYVEFSNNYHKLGTMYHEIRNGINTLRFHQAASTKYCFDRLIGCMILKSTLLVFGIMGQFKPALDNEKRAYGLYRLVLGDEHELTKNSGINLQVNGLFFFSVFVIFCFTHLLICFKLTILVRDKLTLFPSPQLNHSILRNLR